MEFCSHQYQKLSSNATHWTFCNLMRNSSYQLLKRNNISLSITDVDVEIYLIEQQCQPTLNWDTLKLRNYYSCIPNISIKWKIDYKQLELNWRWGRKPLCFCYKLALNISNIPEEYYRSLAEWFKNFLQPLNLIFDNFPHPL